MDFEDIRLCDLLDKVVRRAEAIAEQRSVAEFKELGKEIQSVYDFVISARNGYESIQPMLKNLFSSFNYAAVIINDAVKQKKLDKEANGLLQDCLEIISACCVNIKKTLSE